MVGGLTVQSLAAGREHACGLTTTGAAHCWGYNRGGGLGDGTGAVSSTPVRVIGVNDFVSITASFDHTCALTSACAAYCWGANSSGDLGNGTTVDRPTPLAVAEALAFVTLSAGGGAHTRGVTTTGAI